MMNATSKKLNGTNKTGFRRHVNIFDVVEKLLLNVVEQKKKMQSYSSN